MGDETATDPARIEVAEQASHDPRLETIASFLTRAFPEGTVPFPRYHDKDPTAGLHYAFNLTDWEEGNEVAVLDTRRKNGLLLSTWPLWPPDMFAVVATLMEQSGSYLRMIYCGEGPKAPTDPNQKFDAARIITDTVGSDAVDAGSSNNLCFDNKTLKVLRIIGALWREGCLFISGDGGKVSATVQDRTPTIIQQLCLRCWDALEGLEASFHGEFDEGEVNALSRDAMVWFRSKHLQSKGVDGQTHYFMPADATPEDKGLVLTQILANHLEISAGQDAYQRPGPERAADLRRASVAQLPFAYTGRFEVVLCLWAIDFLGKLWDELRDNAEPYVLGSDFSGKLKRWQVACAMLLAIADEASRSIGFTSEEPGQDATAKIEDDQETLATTSLSDGLEHIGDNDLVGLTCRDLWEIHTGIMIAHKKLPRNLARSVDESIATVMPKARVPSAGCTIRSLSHHLALLPPKGRIRTRWAQQKGVEDFPTFNLLLVPYPYEIRSSDVEPCIHDVDDRDKEWGRFTVEPGWLSRPPLAIGSGIEPLAPLRSREMFLDFVDALIGDQPDGVINGLVFPEGALTTELFRALTEHILQHGTDEIDEFGQVTKPGRLRSITFLTAGLVDRKIDGIVKKGNFVATYMRLRGGAHWSVQHARSKHHRWSLNKPQLASYALSNRLAPDKIWWENIELPPREMLFAEFSRGSVLTSLICEDLARIDPCQAALRAVGPNLSLVLLMDSAQIVNRWPAQYAGVLADDPGTSVLTLTSFGLLRRANLSDGHTSRAIALWREPQSKGREIELPVGYHAQLLSLRRERQREVTVDGRGDGTSSIVWKLAGVVPIRVAPARLPPGYPHD